MKYKTYPKMKDSGIDWIGEIPEHWGGKRLKFLSKERLQYGANESGDINVDEGIRYIRITDIDDSGKLKNNYPKFLNKEEAKDYLLEEGDVLLARSGATVGKTLLYEKSMGECCFAGYLIRFRANDEILSRLFYYYTQSKSYWSFINSNLIQATIQNFSAERYNEIFFPYAISLDEQHQISDFLDTENCKVDKEILSNQKLIKLLQEKKQSVINHAVIQGLDDTVPMKDSGIEWIGDIPKHWDEVNLGFLATFYVPMRDKPPNFEGTIPWLRIEDINGKFASDSLSKQYVNKKIVDEMNLKIFPIGTVLCSCSATIGFCSITTHEVITNQTFIGIYPNDLLYNEFLYYFLNAQTDNIRLLGVGATIPYIQKEKFKKLKIVLPPKSEQIQISKYLDEEITKIDSLISKVKMQTEKLIKFNQSLIFSATTGKIRIID